MSRLALSLVAFALLAPLVVGQEAPSFAPREVVAASSGLVVTVAWAPGDTLADSYRVYGLAPGMVPTLLFETAEMETPAGFAATVPGGFPAYAVSGVRGGQESPLVEAAGTPCDVTVETTPAPDVSTDCLRPKPLMVHIP